MIVLCGINFGGYHYMEIIAIYNQVQSLLEIVPTAITKSALNNAKLSLRERQFLHLLDKDDELSALAVSKLANKIDLHTLVEQELLKVTVKALIDTESEQTESPIIASNEAIVSTVSKATNKQALKNTKLASFLTAYKDEVMIEAENCSVEQCSTCAKVEICVADTTDEVEYHDILVNDTKEDEPVINPEFEAIMIAQALLDVA